MASLQPAILPQAKQLRTAQKERARAVKTLRQCVVSSNTTELPGPYMVQGWRLHIYVIPPPPADVSAQSEALTQASQPEVLLALRNVEDELVRHKAYLDQLLSVVLDRSPDILTKLEKAHRTRYSQTAGCDAVPYDTSSCIMQGPYRLRQLVLRVLAVTINLPTLFLPPIIIILYI